MALCVCDSGLDANDCCAPLHAGKPALTALALMRSRYAAFATGNMDYLAKTCTPELRKGFTGSVDPSLKWLGLKILRVFAGGEGDETGQVEFAYSYELNGREYAQQELSDFCRIDGAWVYAGAAKREGEKTGRNDPCPCGSGKKFKKCCGA